MKFYLGVHRPHWLWDESVRAVPLFLSHHQLKTRKSPFPKALTRWALDSGGFSELDRHSRFETTPKEYVAAVRRYSEELGSLDWASPQDWMCEPWMIAKTGLSIAEHQRRTVENFLLLTELAPELPFIPVLQGWELKDYVTCLGLYLENGVDLRNYPTVGIGSVCRRQSTDQIGEIFERLSRDGLKMHGFGVKSAGVAKYGQHLTSADSMAWSYRARRKAHDDRAAGTEKTCPKTNCANCLHFALEWRASLLERA